MVGMHGSSVAMPWDPIFETLVLGDERNGSEDGDAELVVGVRDPRPRAEKRVYPRRH
jgi:hypothetical protein